MKLIPSATLFKCDLPKANTLSGMLEDNAFVELSSIEAARTGFVPMFDGIFVANFEGGYAFKVRYDEKIIPNAAVANEVTRMLEKIEQEQDRKTGKKERRAVKDEAYFNLLPRALVKTTNITCFYLPEDRLLIVPTAGKKMADITMSRLRKAVGAIKATTIYLDGIKNSMTTKLGGYLEHDNNTFSGFEVSGQVKLKGREGASQLSVKEADLYEAKEALLEALSKGFKVEEIGLENQDLFFRIDSNFRIKGVEFLGEPDNTDFEDEQHEFEVCAAIQTLLFVNASNMLLKLFEYKEPESEDASSVI